MAQIILPEGAAASTPSAGNVTIYAKTDGKLYAKDDAGNEYDLTVSSGGSSYPQDFRLTLTSGLPVTTSDVTAAGTIYCTPYKGNQIALYSGSAWNVRTSAEFSLALSGLTSGKPYDVFCYDNGGTPTLEFLVWTNDTTRATALAYQDGVLVKSGAATRRYLGTFYTTGTTTTEDSAANRYLWNYYHRVKRRLRKTESTSSWTYTTATFRPANNNSANVISFVIGGAEGTVSAEVIQTISNTAAGNTAVSSIGYDSTSAEDPDVSRTIMTSTGAGYYVPLIAKIKKTPTAGKHYYCWLEYANVGGTTTWYGGSSNNSGIYGEIIN